MAAPIVLTKLVLQNFMADFKPVYWRVQGTQGSFAQRVTFQQSVDISSILPGSITNGMLLLEFTEDLASFELGVSGSILVVNVPLSTNPALDVQFFSLPNVEVVPDQPPLLGSPAALKVGATPAPVPDSRCDRRHYSRGKIERIKERAAWWGFAAGVALCAVVYALTRSSR